MWEENATNNVFVQNKIFQEKKNSDCVNPYFLFCTLVFSTLTAQRHKNNKSLKIKIVHTYSK